MPNYNQIENPELKALLIKSQAIASLPEEAQNLLIEKVSKLPPEGQTAIIEVLEKEQAQLAEAVNKMADNPALVAEVLLKQKNEVISIENQMNKSVIQAKENADPNQANPEQILDTLNQNE